MLFLSSEIIDIIINGLKQLEYRGYDSAGLCIEGDKPGEVLIYRAVGKVALLREKVDKSTVDKTKTFMSHGGMAHTRWATHGVPSERNCHPHRSDKNNEFVVVHNGMLTNYNKIRSYLEKHGYVFESDTDTEAIAKLLKFINDAEPNQSFDVLIKKALAILEGSLAIIVKSTFFPEAIACARRGSPLVIGVSAKKDVKEVPVHRDDIELVKPGEEDKVLDAIEARRSTNNLLGVPGAAGGLSRNSSQPDLLGPDPNLYRTKSTVFLSENDTPIPIEFFIASDASPIVEHTKQVIYLEDYDVAIINDGELHVHVAKPKTQEEKIRELLPTPPKPKPEPKKPEIVKGVIQTLELEVSRIKKGDYDHYMKKEISEQPESMMDTMRGRINFQEHTIRLGGLVKEMD
ncbi:glutamine--fructose-6-phosphate transaminase (isomerizing), partial [Gonapodya sp. JEL0774]